MIDFRNKDSQIPSFLIVFFLIALIVLAVVQFVIPKPKVNLATHRKLQLAAGLDTKKAQDLLDKSSENVQQKTLVVEEELVAPEVLRILGDSAKKHDVKVSSFRPQRTGDKGTLKIVPFQVSVEGKYLDVISVVRELEAAEGKVTVNQVILSSTDGNDDRVNATVGIVAVAAPKLVGLPVNAKEEVPDETGT